jgi:hypothetical protein
VPEVMQPDQAQARGLDDALEGTAQVPGLNRPTVRGGEDQGLASPLTWSDTYRRARPGHTRQQLAAGARTTPAASWTGPMSSTPAMSSVG